MTTLASPTSPNRPRVVIVGGGFGGIAVARALRKSKADVVVFDRRNHHVFQPLLYQVATAALSPANIAAPVRRILSRQRNCRVYMGEVHGVDPVARTIRVGSGDFHFDYLVLATGVETNYFGSDEWAQVAPGLKTIDEAIAVRRRFLLAFEQAETEDDPDARRAALTFAIVGAGPTGVELAGAVAEISRHTLRRDFRHIDTKQVRVLLIDLQDRVLPSFDPGLSERAKDDLEGLGVEVLLSTRVLDVDANGLTVEAEGESARLDANNVIWAAGVKATPLGSFVPDHLDGLGRVKVGDDLSVPGFPNIFAIGDFAHRVDPASGEVVPGVAQGAIQMGEFVGKNLARELAGSGSWEPSDRGVFRYRDNGAMATIGKNRAVAEIGKLKFGGALAFLVWALVHVLFLIDFRHKVVTLAEWTWMYFFHERGVRLITGEDVSRVKPPVD